MKYQFARFHVSGINGTAEQQKRYEDGYDAIDWGDAPEKPEPEYSREDEIERMERQLELPLFDDREE